MKTSSGKVIKSHNVKYSNSTIDEKNQCLMPDGDPKLSHMESLKDKFADRLQKAGKESYEKGLSEGIKKGRELQNEETLYVVQSMNQVIKETVALKETILANAEKEIIELSLSIAEKVLHSEVKTNGEVIKNVLKDAIRNIVDRDNMKIRLNPVDFRKMMEIKTDFLKNYDGIKNILFEEDGSIQQGGAIVETMFGEVDARLEQQYHEVEVAMTSPGSYE